MGTEECKVHLDLLVFRDLLGIVGVKNVNLTVSRYG